MIAYAKYNQIIPQRKTVSLVRLNKIQSETIFVTGFFDRIITKIEEEQNYQYLDRTTDNIMKLNGNVFYLTLSTKISELITESVNEDTYNFAIPTSEAIAKLSGPFSYICTYIVAISENIGNYEPETIKMMKTFLKSPAIFSVIISAKTLRIQKEQPGLNQYENLKLLIDCADDLDKACTAIMNTQ